MTDSPAKFTYDNFDADAPSLFNKLSLSSNSKDNDSNAGAIGAGATAQSSANTSTSTTNSSAAQANSTNGTSHSLFERNFSTDSAEGDVNGDHQEPAVSGADTNAEVGQSQLTLRALVSTKEAGVIIGKGGKNVAELRESTGVKAGVSKVVQGVHDRVLSVTGQLDGVSKAYSLIARTILENPINVSPPSTPINPPTGTYTSLRLLISHNLMGTIIGRQGLKIKHIQDVSGARMVASKEMLPQSTERVVEVQGTVEALRVAIWEIGKCLIEDWERGVGTVHYQPVIRLQGNEGRTSLGGGGSGGPTLGAAPSRRSNGEYITRTGNGSDFSRPRNASGSGPSARRDSLGSPTSPNDPNVRTQNISIPADMVGCIIGKGGSKISEIRRLSGSRISIAKTPHDETGERMFTIQGSAEANEKALFLLYNQLESEKERRLHAQQDVQEE